MGKFIKTLGTVASVVVLIYDAQQDWKLVKSIARRLKS